MRIIFTILASLVFVFASAQHQGLAPCGTPSFKSKWLKEYQKNPHGYPKSDTVLYVPLTIHLVGTDGGGGYFKPKSLLEALMYTS